MKRFLLIKTIGNFVLNERNYFTTSSKSSHQISLNSLETFNPIIEFNQDNHFHSRKVTSIFDWNGNSNLICSVGLDNNFIFYDIRLSKPVMNFFLECPLPNNIKVYNDRMVVAPKSNIPCLKVFDLRRFDQEYSYKVVDFLSEKSKDYILTSTKNKFNNQDLLVNKFDINSEQKARSHTASKLSGLFSIIVIIIRKHLKLQK